MKKLVSLKGVFDNLRQSVNSPSSGAGVFSPTSGTPTGGGGSAWVGSLTSPQHVCGPVKMVRDIAELLTPDQFTCEDTLRHGLIERPVCFDFDPIQKVLAIGNKSGAVKLYGRPGIDMLIQHENEPCVFLVKFIYNTGKVITCCTNDTINLWSFEKRDTPELLNSIQLNREHLTSFCLEFLDNFMYIGTEKGNVMIMNVDTFSLSGYQIAWNKGMDPMQKNHPGEIIELLVSPTDSSKLLIGYRSGLITYWDLPSRKGEQRFAYKHRLRSISWHHEGRQFVASYSDGSLLVWSLRGIGNASSSSSSCNSTQTKPVSITFPHSVKGKVDTKEMLTGHADSVTTGNGGGKSQQQTIDESFDPISKVKWVVNRVSGESSFIFSGGLPSDMIGVTPSVTILSGKSITLLEMEYSVLDFCLVTDSPYPADSKDVEAILVMLNHDLVAVDCKSTGFPCFKNPYVMDLNESAVTACEYVVDCAADLIPQLYMLGKSKSSGTSVGGSSSSKKQQTQHETCNFSQKEWPVSGGVDGNMDFASSYQELIITGHADGSVRFWDATDASMLALTKIRTHRYFERNRQEKYEGLETEPFGIQKICLLGKYLAVTGASCHVILFELRKSSDKVLTETVSMEIPIVYEVMNTSASPRKTGGGAGKDSVSTPPALGSSAHRPHHFDFAGVRPVLNVASQSAAYVDPVEGFTFDKPQYEYYSPLSYKPSSQKKSSGSGFNAKIVCFTPWVNGEAPSPISALTISSSLGLMAYGNRSGLVVIDLIQSQCLLNMGTADLYGSSDPFQRIPRSPRQLSKFSSSMDIVKVDLGSYSQIGTTSATEDVSGSTPEITTKLLESMQSNNSSEGNNNSSNVKVQVSKNVSDSGVSPPVEGELDHPQVCQKLSDESSAATDSSYSPGLLNSRLVSSEGVTYLCFTDTYVNRSSNSSSAKAARTMNCLRVGTSIGTMLHLIINVPPSSSSNTSSSAKDVPCREADPVVISPSGFHVITASRSKILTSVVLDCCGSSSGKEGVLNSENVFKPPFKNDGVLESIPSPCKSPTEATLGKSGRDASSPNKSAADAHLDSSSLKSPMDRQLTVICSEKVASVYALPSFRLTYSINIHDRQHHPSTTDPPSVLCAKVVDFLPQDYDKKCFNACLLTYSSDGFIKAFSIPSLRPMISIFYMTPFINTQLLTFAAKYGHGIHFPNGSELQKFVIHSEYIQRLSSIRGRLFKANVPLPDPPKQSFLKGLFGVGGGSSSKQTCNREELFGEAASGKIGGSVATHIAGVGDKMASLQGSSVSTTSEVGKAHSQFLERGQKVSELEDRTEQMHNEAKQFASSANRLLADAKNKKWYQL